ncbi:MAG: PhoH family protein [bacterium]|nr:PhoH family protein [bacterium]
MEEGVFEVDDITLYQKICGYNDTNIRKLEKFIGIEIIPRGNTLIVKAPEDKCEKTIQLFHLMSDLLQVKDGSYEFNDFDLKYMANSVISGKKIKFEDIERLKIRIHETGKTIVPRTINQGNYIAAIHNSSITFGVGPAGTGKTFLAVAVALHYFLKGQVDKIVLTRPAVEAGESLGFLPGDLIQKINPYLRPLYDALFDLLTMEKVAKLIEIGTIEIAPLAYMRGRTLNNAFIILDEAQNTTVSQMKMFLTRLGNNSKLVISGDITQIDLDKSKKSGLLQVIKILKGVDDISFTRFAREDISRHPVVEKIVAAYERSGYTD